MKSKFKLNNFLPLLIIFFSLIFTLFPLKVYADSENTSIEKYNMDISINNDGSINISEILDIKFHGSFNGGFKDISIKETDGLKDLRVFLMEGTNETEFILDNNAKKGDSNVYSIENQSSDMYRIKMFIPTKNSVRRFKLTYTLKNVCKLYNDIGELYFNVWDTGYKSEVSNVNVSLNIPCSFDDNSIKYFSHGAKSSDSSLKKHSDKTVLSYSVKSLDENEYFSIRTLFPKDVIVNSSNNQNKDGFDSIIQEEKAIGEKESKRAALWEKVDSALNIVSMILTAVLSALVFVYIKITRRNIDSNLYSLPPEDCSPAVACTLLYGTLTGNVFISSIVDLNRKGIINLSKADYFTKKNKEDYIISINYDKIYNSGLKAHEISLLEFLNNYTSSSHEISMRELSKKLKKSQSQCYKFNVKWQKEVKEEALNLGYYDKSLTIPGIVMIIFSCLSIILSIFAIARLQFFAFTPLILSIIILILGIILIVRKSDKGLVQYKRLINFKKAVTHNGFVENNMAYPYGDYLPYMMILNVPTKTLKAFKDFAETDSILSANKWLMTYLLLDSFSNHNSFYHYGTHSFASSSGMSSMGSSTGGGGGAGGGGAGGF